MRPYGARGVVRGCRPRVPLRFTLGYYRCSLQEHDGSRGGNNRNKRREPEETIPRRLKPSRIFAELTAPFDYAQGKLGAVPFQRSEFLRNPFRQSNSRNDRDDRNTARNVSVASAAMRART